MLRVTSLSRLKLRKVRASSIEDIFAHCSWLLGENEHYIYYDSKEVSKSSLREMGKMTY